MSELEIGLEHADYSMMGDLPNEILSRIFGFVQLEDRKNIRRVCKSWYHCSTISSITKNEKFVFRSDCNIKKVGKVMLQSNFSFSNLEFQGLPILRLSTNFWKVYGSQIRSLEFSECIGIEGTIKNIITHCENLVSFSFKTSMQTLMRHPNEKILHLSQFLDEIIEKGIRRTKLGTFCLIIDNSDWDTILNQIFIKILLVYPCIRHFGARTIHRDTVSCLPNSLESLTLIHELEDKHCMEKCIAKAEQGLRLRRLQTVLRTDHDKQLSFMDKIWPKFFLSQENLNVVHLQCGQYSYRPTSAYYSHRDVKNIIFHILESSPNLKEFSVTLYCAGHLDLDWEELRRFFASISKLENLNIAFNVPVNSTIPDPLCEASKYLLFPQNLALTTLELSTPYRNCEAMDRIYAAVLLRCSSLLHLKLSVYISAGTLQIIFEHLLKLQTLVLQCGEIECPDYAFIGHEGNGKRRGYSIKRLQQLKHLEIHGALSQCGKQQLGKILLEFKFPCLEVLRLHIRRLEELPEEVLVQFPFQIPELRELSIFDSDAGPAYIEKMIQFCKHLRKLHRLFVSVGTQERKVTPKKLHFQNNLREFVNARIEEIFNVCSSLRYVSVDSFSVFSYDPLTKKVVAMNGSGIFKFGKPIFNENNENS